MVGDGGRKKGEDGQTYISGPSFMKLRCLNYTDSQQDNENDLPQPENGAIMEPQQITNSSRDADTLTHEKDAEDMSDYDETGTLKELCHFISIGGGRQWGLGGH